jgi:hypothetical protein
LGNNLEQFGKAKGLVEQRRGAQVSGLLPFCGTEEGRHEDDLVLGILLAEIPKQVQAGLVGHVKVSDDDWAVVIPCQSLSRRYPVGYRLDLSKSIGLQDLRQ